MKTERIFLIVLLVFCLSSVNAYSDVGGYLDSSNPSIQQTETANFCALAKKTDEYKGKIIRVKVVLVEFFLSGAVDGDDPFIYAPECGEKGFASSLRWDYSSYNQSPALEALKRIENNRKGYASRARVTLVGEFSGYGKHKFGHLGWADAEFTIHTVEKAESVPTNLPWPKRERDNKSPGRTR
jgi:hypothetical protein